MTSPEPSAQTDAWVTSTSPLMVRTLGATKSCPAAALASASVSVNDHVQVTLRTPMKPLIQGVVA